MSKSLDATLAILNGLVGDYLHRENNGLATDMAFFQRDRALALEPSALARSHPEATGRVVVLVHGVMTTENVWLQPDGSDYGKSLASDAGFTPFYLRYNTGLAIADNGAGLARLLGELLRAYPRPVDELLLLGYSMGGLVVRSACHFASAQSDAWLSLVKRAVYVGTPHLGAPGERVGRVVAKVLAAIDDPYTKLIADIGNLRSSGIKDLGNADLRHEDRQDQGERLSLLDARHPVPLLPGISHYLIAGSLAQKPLAALFGDSVVPVSSATWHSALLPEQHVKLLPGLSHVALAHSPDVYERIKAWCEEPP